MQFPVNVETNGLNLGNFRCANDKSHILSTFNIKKAEIKQPALAPACCGRDWRRLQPLPHSAVIADTSTLTAPQ